MLTFKLIDLLFQFSPRRNTKNACQCDLDLKKKRIYDILKTFLGV